MTYLNSRKTLSNPPANIFLSKLPINSIGLDKSTTFDKVIQGFIGIGDTSFLLSVFQYFSKTLATFSRNSSF